MIDITLFPSYTAYALGGAVALTVLLTYVRSRRQQQPQQTSAV